MLRSQVQRHLKRKRRYSLRELIHFSHPRLVDKPFPVHFCWETKANSSCQGGRITALGRKKKRYFYNLLQFCKHFHVFGGAQPPGKQVLLFLPQGLSSVSCSGLSFLSPIHSQYLAPCLASNRCFTNGSSVGKECACSGDVGSIPGSGRSPGKGNGNPLQ